MSKLFLFLLFLAGGFHVSGQAPLQPRDTSVKGPQSFAFIMGVSKYKYIRPLSYADKDAEMFRDYLRSPGGGSMKNENIFCLLNEQANNSNFWGKGFQWLKAKQLQKGDRLFIYLAGHGDAIDEDEFFFLGYDCNPAGDKNNYLVSGAIQLFNLKKKIAKETTKGVEVFFIMDACRSNELPGGSEGQNFLNTAISEKKVGDMMMLATAAGQESLEDASIGNGHGLFTYYLVDGLSGLADTEGTPDNKVTFSELKSYVDKNVPILALQRFKKKQQPYFCCNEFNEHIVSKVDPAYLDKWLQKKKQQTRGNSVPLTGNDTYNKAASLTADTVLIETYNLFNKAVKANRLSGPASAEAYFQQLEKKYPGNPYTLDASSTLAVEYINAAQQKVDRYLGCGDEGSARERQENYTSALNLEKAIRLVREDDEDFANSLLNRLYFLKACGDFGKDGKNGEGSMAFQFAYGALAIDRNGAYIQNKLAQLHLANNRADSALYYAEKATKTAPNWACALTTLALVQKSIAGKNEQSNNDIQPKKPKVKSGIGYTLGIGMNQSKPTYSGNANTGYTDVQTAGSAASINAGIIYQVGLGVNFSIRPAATVGFENMEIDFYKRSGTGGQVITEKVLVKNGMVSIALPLIIRLTAKKTAPFLSLGPSFSYLFGQDNISGDILPVKKSVFAGHAGLGVDIGLGKSGFILSPEINYTLGLSDMKDNTSRSNYALAVSSLKKQSFSLNLYLKKK